MVKQNVAHLARLVQIPHKAERLPQVVEQALYSSPPLLNSLDLLLAYPGNGCRQQPPNTGVYYTVVSSRDVISVTGVPPSPNYFPRRYGVEDNSQCRSRGHENKQHLLVDCGGRGPTKTWQSCAVVPTGRHERREGSRHGRETKKRSTAAGG